MIHLFNINIFSFSLSPRLRPAECKSNCDLCGEVWDDLLQLPLGRQVPCWLAPGLGHRSGHLLRAHVLHHAEHRNIYCVHTAQPALQISFFWGGIGNFFSHDYRILKRKKLKQKKRIRADPDPTLCKIYHLFSRDIDSRILVIGFLTNLRFEGQKLFQVLYYIQHLFLKSKRVVDFTLDRAKIGHPYIDIS